jgi:hypothetical protein
MRKNTISVRQGAALGLWTLSSIVFALSLSWFVLAANNFLYPVWHDVGGIGAGIDKYGPKNRYKPGFGDTTKAQRSDIFAEINRAVHAHGDGLADITYQTKSSRGRQLLLHESEVVHLQDVANLIDFVRWFAVIGTTIFVLLSIYLYRSRYVRVSWKGQGLGIFGLIICVAAVLMIFGVEETFEQLHIWVFPDDHQWFFYYQESLMSTLMLAPTLFGWIAAALAGIALCIWLSTVTLFIRLQGQRYDLVSA